LASLLLFIGQMQPPSHPAHIQSHNKVHLVSSAVLVRGHTTFHEDTADEANVGLSRAARACRLGLSDGFIGQGRLTMVWEKVSCANVFKIRGKKGGVRIP
jgi:hypothetical protein